MFTRPRYSLPRLILLLSLLLSASPSFGQTTAELRHDRMGALVDPWEDGAPVEKSSTGETGGAKGKAAGKEPPANGGPRPRRPVLWTLTNGAPAPCGSLGVHAVCAERPPSGQARIDRISLFL